VLVDKETEAKIMAVVNAEPKNTKSAAMCSQIATANLERIRLDEDAGGCNSFGPPFTQATGFGWDTSTEPKNKEDMIALAKRLNPVVGFYDPLKLSEGEFWGDSNEATIGWIRQAEIKHGRIAMAGFVGFIVHSNGIHFPYKMPGDEFVGGSAVDLWYNLPYAAKAQIIAFIGIMEWWGELRLDGATEKHYMRGGKPGYFPPFDDLPHPVPFNLFDPFGFQKGKSDEWKAKRLNIELNNGRLAMLGLMSFLSEGAIPGSVPALKGLIPQNSYDVMSLDFALHGFK
jgi:hypothetical protein